jgi:2-dehydro-3-deoxyphosphogluconate aldolase/(4S)-4-hydroxy-2-oxoglutarate aldolase
MNAIDRLGELGVVPVVKIDRAGDGPDFARALMEGGLPCAEITFRTNAAEEAIRLIHAAQPEMLVGAGTVLTIPQAEQAVAAGARFIVSPGFDPKVVDWCLARNMPIIPGIATSTEALMAMDRGLNVLKFFPSEILGGTAMLEAISAALVGVKFLPTGGISLANMAAYLQLRFVHAVAGSWLATSKMIAAGAFADITRLTREAVAVVGRVRSYGGEP